MYTLVNSGLIVEIDRDVTVEYWGSEKIEEVNVANISILVDRAE